MSRNRGFKMNIIRTVCIGSALLVGLAGCTQMPEPPVAVQTPPVKSMTVADGALKSPLLCDGLTVYEPLPAFPAANYQDVATVDGKITPIHKDWPKKNDEVNKLLPNISSEISVKDIKGKFAIGPFINASGAQKRITIDFMKYRSEPIYTNDGQVMLYSRIGAGLRLTLNVVTTDTSLSSGSLLAIAFSASGGKTKGEISADIIGMDNKDITLSMPFTSDVSEGSIAKIIEALAVIKAKLHDSQTDISPQFIASINCVKPS